MTIRINTIQKSGKRDSSLELTQFYGGDKYGPMLQLTQGSGVDPDDPTFIHLTVQDTYQLIQHLTQWVQTLSARESIILGDKIKADKILAGTLWEEAVKCEHFIQELRILEMPLRLLNMIPKDKKEDVL